VLHTFANTQSMAIRKKRAPWDAMVFSKS